VEKSNLGFYRFGLKRKHGGVLGSLRRIREEGGVENI